MEFTHLKNKYSIPDHELLAFHTVAILLGLFLLFAIFFIPLYASEANASGSGLDISPPIVSTPESDERTYVIETHRQVILSTKVQNPLKNEAVPVVILAEIRDPNGVTIYLAWQSGLLAPQQESTVGFSWSPDTPSEYEIRAFAISSLQNPMVLSSVITSAFIVTDDQELLRNADKIRIPDSFHEPNYIWQDSGNYTVKQIADQHEFLCGQEYSEFNSILRSMRQDDEYFPYWFPQKVEFRFLQSNETFYRQPCTETYSDVILYADYITNDNATIKIDSSNASDLFHIETAEQALEYLYYFTFRGGNTDAIGIIPTVDAYTSYTINCETSNDSPVRFVRITQQDDKSMVFEMNVDDGGSVEYHKWKFEPNLPPLLISSAKLGQCPVIE